jgi:hypothetical protein
MALLFHLIAAAEVRTSLLSQGDDSSWSGSGILEALNELQQARLQGIPGCFWQVEEAEGLEPALGGPHGEHHFRLFANGGFAEVEDDFHMKLFVERFLQVHKAAGSRKLMQFASYVAAVGQSNERQDRATQLDAKGAVLADGKAYGRWTVRDRLWSLGHRS